jgi:hypothetical protein
VDVLPRKFSMLFLNRLGGGDQNQRLRNLEPGRSRRRRPQEALPVIEPVQIEHRLVDRLFQHQAYGGEHLVDRPVRKGATTSLPHSPSAWVGVGLGESSTCCRRGLDDLTLAKLCPRSRRPSRRRSRRCTKDRSGPQVCASRHDPLSDRANAEPLARDDPLSPQASRSCLGAPDREPCDRESLRRRGFRCRFAARLDRRAPAAMRPRSCPRVA